MSRSSDPQPVAMEKGETRLWCACGKSDQRPFCDRYSCQGATPVPFTAARKKIVFFCGCGSTTTAPICDGKSHHR